MSVNKYITIVLKYDAVVNNDDQRMCSVQCRHRIMDGDQNYSCCLFGGLTQLDFVAGETYRCKKCVMNERMEK